MDRLLDIVIALCIAVVSLGVFVLLLSAAGTLWQGPEGMWSGPIVNWLQVLAVGASAGIALYLGLTANRREERRDRLQQQERLRVHRQAVSLSERSFKDMYRTARHLRMRLFPLGSSQEIFTVGEAKSLASYIESAISRTDEALQQFPGQQLDPKNVEIHLLHREAVTLATEFKRRLEEIQKANYPSSIKKDQVISVAMQFGEDVSGARARAMLYAHMLTQEIAEIRS